MMSASSSLWVRLKFLCVISPTLTYGHQLQVVTERTGL